MSGEPDCDDNEDLEREIRANRKFSLSEALGRMAGGGMMKGESPITRKQQAELAIDEYLRLHLTDGGGVLRGVLMRHVRGSQLFLEDYDRPLIALASYTRQTLESEPLLQELVREADVEWGRLLGERPYFERPGDPPHPEDPYTMHSVRVTLSQLFEELRNVAGRY